MDTQLAKFALSLLQPNNTFGFSFHLTQGHVIFANFLFLFSLYSMNNYDENYGSASLPFPSHFALTSCVSQSGVTGEHRLSESCTVDCPVSCVLSGWSQWAECSHSCGGRGKHTERRATDESGRARVGTSLFRLQRAGVRRASQSCMNTFKDINI